MDRRTHSLPEAAKVAGLSEDELRCAIKDGALRAELLPATGEVQIRAEDLAEFLRQGRPGSFPRAPRRRRVLIIDDEINFANILKLELERDPRIEAKFATWGRDGVMMAEDYAPDLCLIDFMLPDITGDDVLAALRQQKQTRQAKMVVYSAHTREVIREHPRLEERLESLGADHFMSKSAGLRAVIAKVFELLGLDRTRVVRRPH